MTPHRWEKIHKGRWKEWSQIVPKWFQFFKLLKALRVLKTYLCKCSEHLNYCGCGFGKRPGDENMVMGAKVFRGEVEWDGECGKGEMGHCGVNGRGEMLGSWNPNRVWINLIIGGWLGSEILLLCWIFIWVWANFYLFLTSWDFAFFRVQSLVTQLLTNRMVVSQALLNVNLVVLNAFLNGMGHKGQLQVWEEESGFVEKKSNCLLLIRTRLIWKERGN